MKNLIILLFLLSLTTSAAEKSLIKIVSGFESTSDQFTLRSTSISFFSNRRDLFWSFDEEEREAWDFGGQVTKVSGNHNHGLSGKRGDFFFARKISPEQYLSLSTGASIFKYAEIERSTFVFTANYLAVFSKTNLSFSLSRDYFYNVRGITSPLTNGLTHLKSLLQVTNQIGANYKIIGSLKFYKVSDGNFINEEEISFLAGTSFPTWLWIGWGTSHLGNSKEDSGYWSPEKFWSHGPRFELSRAVWEKITLGLAYNYNFIKEDSLPGGASFYGALRMEYGNRNDFLVGLSLNKIKSRQTGNEWRSEGGELYFQKSF